MDLAAKRRIGIFAVFCMFLAGCSGGQAVKAVYLADIDSFGKNELYVNKINRGDRAFTERYKVSNGEALVNIPAPSEDPLSYYPYTVSPDNKYVAFVTASGVFVASTSSTRTVIDDRRIVRVGDRAKMFRWSPDSRWLAMWDDSGIHVSAYDGTTNRHVVSRRLGDYGYPKAVFGWTPDSRRLVYVAINQQLYTVNRDGTHDVLLSGSFAVNATRLRSLYIGNSQVIYMAYRHGLLSPANFDLYSVQYDGSVLRFDIPVVVNRKISGDMPDFGDVKWFAVAPDGRRVAFLADREVDERFELYTVNVDGTNLRRVSGSIVDEGDVDFFSSSWSADGNWLAYKGDMVVDEKQELFIVRPDGTGRRNLSGTLPDYADVKKFKWSPDGAMLYYTCDRSTDEQFDMYRVLPGGPEIGNKIVSVPPGREFRQTKWSPDSRWVAYVLKNKDANPFANNLNPDTDLYVVYAANGVSKKVSDDYHMVFYRVPGSYYIAGGFSWTPDSERIIYQAIDRAAYSPPRGVVLKLKLLSNTYSGGDTDDIAGAFEDDRDVKDFTIIED